MCKLLTGYLIVVAFEIILTHRSSPFPDEWFMHDSKHWMSPCRKSADTMRYKNMRLPVRCMLPLVKHRKTRYTEQWEAGDWMEMERLKVLKDSPKSRVYLVYDHENRCMAVEKHLAGEITVYRQLQRLSHPYLPRIYEVHYAQSETVVLEEYIAGSSLGQTKASEKQLTRWMLELCSVLAFLHRHRILHRDIKPSNLLLGQDGHIRLIDFDAARIQKTAADSDTRLLGTRGYAPPEQYGFAQTDERADIYALGITFQELLGSLQHKLRWKHILRRCTALEPKHRYHHACQIRFAIYAGKIRRRILYPLFALVTTVALGFMAWSYTTDVNVKEAVDVVFSSRRALIFDTVSIAELRASDAVLRDFAGDELAVYQRLMDAEPNRAYISTGYTDENGCLLFGGFATTCNIRTGVRDYSRFEGLFTFTVDSTVRCIPPEDCMRYAPAVLVLYELDIFDTPIF